MTDLRQHRRETAENGFSVIQHLYTAEEINRLLAVIEQADSSGDLFRKSTDLFAIRQFLKEVPGAADIIFCDRLKKVINEVFGEGYFAVRSIYFDKPENSNWFVARHQDLTIAVEKKMELEGFGPWTVKQQQYAVQPPLQILENCFTIRIHLDSTDENNGALKVIPKSHLKKIYRPEAADYSGINEVTCAVDRGGIMIMKPLLLHSSGRTTNKKRRRVVHIEFSNQELPEGLNWAERININPLTAAPAAACAV